MKKVRFILHLSIATGLALSLMLTSCDTKSEESTQKDILPASIRIDVPASITTSSSTSGRIANGRTKADTLKGNDIYKNLCTFIAVGDGASQIVQNFIEGIRTYHIDRVLSLTIVSNDDNRTKKLVITSQVTFENQPWDYQLTVTDADSESQPDGGKALQLFWNKTQLVKGIAIIKPYNCDRIKNANSGNTIFRIDYTEGGSSDYDATMEVRIAGLPLPSPTEQPFAISTLHMFVGKKGDVVDVFGNSSHPNGHLFTSTTGIDWAFVASANDTKDVGVAEVGLPPCTLDDSDRTTLLKQYSINSVFTTEITAAWPGIDQTTLNAYLTNTAAPGYFNDAVGFLAGGASPGADWDALASRLSALSPYNPLQTNNLTITFQ